MQTLQLSPARLPCRGLDPEEPIVSTANLCSFNHLEVTVRIVACSCLHLCAAAFPKPQKRQTLRSCIPGLLERVCLSQPANTRGYLSAHHLTGSVCPIACAWAPPAPPAAGPLAWSAEVLMPACRRCCWMM